MIKIAKNLEKLALDASKAEQLQLQQYMPQNKKRKFSDKELAEIEAAQSKLLPQFFVSDADPIHAKMFNPLTRAILYGLGGAAGGAAGGGFIGLGIGDSMHSPGPSQLDDKYERGTLGLSLSEKGKADYIHDLKMHNEAIETKGIIGSILGALVGGGGAGLYGYFSQDKKNKDLLEAMTRLQEDATMRDFNADPLVQKEKDRQLAKYFGKLV